MIPNFIPLTKLTFEASPAEKPCIVDDLFSLPDKVIRISSGGLLTAALTSGNDIYIWGTGVVAGSLDRLWSATPFPLDLDGQDFLDVAIGRQHVVVLTTEHKIFVIGANESGQLGLSDKRDYTEWTEVTVALKEQQCVTRVYAGHSNSFLLVESNTE
jgi:alpha-tubulin suppressor-like RCC1 family protein